MKFKYIFYSNKIQKKKTECSKLSFRIYSNFRCLRIVCNSDYRNE